MSTDLIFWRGAKEPNPGEVYRKLNEGENVEGIAEVNQQEVHDALSAALSQWTQNEENPWIWTYEPDSDGNGPGIDVFADRQHVAVGCHGLEGAQMNEIIDVLVHQLGYRLYDPQVDVRFDDF